jgi:hypothetical protein
MVLPGQPPPGRPRSGPLGERAFRGALVGCVALVVLGLLMALLGGGTVASVGVSCLVLGILGLTTSAAGLLLERRVHRRRAPRDLYRRNGRPPRPDPAQIRRGFKGHP